MINQLLGSAYWNEIEDHLKSEFSDMYYLSAELVNSEFKKGGPIEVRCLRSLIRKYVSMHLYSNAFGHSLHKTWKNSHKTHSGERVIIDYTLLNEVDYEWVKFYILDLIVKTKGFGNREVIKDLENENNLEILLNELKGRFNR